MSKPKDESCQSTLSLKEMYHENEKKSIVVAVDSPSMKIRQVCQESFTMCHILIGMK
jgi:hypothetical protein